MTSKPKHTAPAASSVAPGDVAPAPVAPMVEPATLPLRWVKVSHHTPDHIAARYPYAGYGSNLSLSQMIRRCPTADIYGSGMLRNAKLVFAYYLGIVEAEGASTPVAVYTMTAADVAAMDRHEGLGHGQGRNGSTGYERYLVTVEVNGVAVRCFTYVKRDNALEEPSERYYQTCLAGYADWSFDTRRLRHAREDARKHGKRRTYSSAYGCWSSDTPAFDWEAWRATGKGYGKRGSAMIPSVPSYDAATHDYETEEPLGNEAAAKTEPRVSLVTGRILPDSRGPVTRKADERRKAADDWKRKHGSLAPTYAPTDPARTSTLNGQGEATFDNPRTGEHWRKGANGTWYRAKD